MEDVNFFQSHLQSNIKLRTFAFEYRRKTRKANEYANRMESEWSL